MTIYHATNDEMSEQLNVYNVMESWLNGQKKQAVEQVDRLGWDTFAVQLNEMPDSDRIKLNMVLNLLVIKHRR